MRFFMINEFAIKRAVDLFNSGGLSIHDIEKYQEDHGFNELIHSKNKRTLHMLLDIFKEPMVYLLLGCGGIYFTLGDMQESIMLLGFLILILFITIFQETKATKAIESLRDLSSPRTLVLREGKKIRIASREIVNGEIVFLNEGDRIAADGILFFSHQVEVDESMLTGESLPVKKNDGDFIFAGTTFLSGYSNAIIQSIGSQTKMGEIGLSLASSGKRETHLQTDTNELVTKLAIAASLLSLVVFIFYTLNRQSWISGLLAGLTLAMAIMPNELPAVLTIFLSMGASRISSRRVLTRELPAVENLGAATVLCVDKTGTLTLNQMVIQNFYIKNKFIELSELNDDILPEEFHEILEYGILASRQEAHDPMEMAFIFAGNKYLAGTEHLHANWLCEKEYPLSSELLSLTHAWKSHEANGYVVSAKGAPEAILDLCHLKKADLDFIELQLGKMTRQGLRVLGVAKSFQQNEPLPSKQHDFPFEFVGLIGISDPIRSEVPGAIADCKKAGIKVIMLTGDHPITASSVAQKIGLTNPENVISGSDLLKLSDQELQSVLQSHFVFSRVSPQQKLRLVQVLKKNGEIVAMTGDGVNDAPALKSAHIGIAMGKRGTDVARESAALVLLDDDFGSIVDAIRMGRRVFANLQSAFAFLLSVHIPIAGLSILPVIFNLPLVLLPAHIAFLHLIIEPTSSIALENKEIDERLMNEPPRSSSAKVLSHSRLLKSLFLGLSSLLSVLGVYFFAIYQNRPENQIRVFVFSTLISSNLFLILIHLEYKIRKNKIVILIFTITAFLMMALLFEPHASKLFKFSMISVEELIFCLFLGFLSVIWIDLVPKRFPVL